MGRHKKSIEALKFEQILISFYIPTTPRYVEKELGILRLNMWAYVNRDLLVCLNPRAKRGRLYTLTEKGRKFVNLPPNRNNPGTDWYFIGWLVASPRQRTALLSVVDEDERCSEELRIRASKHNQHLTRISTKAILHELANAQLISTRMANYIRYYRITEKGKRAMNFLESIKYLQ